jgi:hypothetical protein
LRALLVVAHPLDNACAKAATERIRTTLERRSYFTTPYVAKSCPEVGPALFNPLCKSQCIATSGCPLFICFDDGLALAKRSG